MINRLILAFARITLGIIEALIGLRIVLKLLGASAASPFVNWIYETTQPLLRPFLGMFPSPRLEGFIVIEFSALFGLVIYALADYVIETIVQELDHLGRRRKD